MELLDEDIILRSQNLLCPLHINPELEIVYVKSGVLKARYGAYQLSVRAGEMLLILPYHIHSFDPSEGCEATVYMFSERVYEEIMKHYQFSVVYEAYPVDAAALNYADYLNRGRERWKEKIYAQSIFCVFINCWITRQQEKQGSTEGETADSQIITYIFEHLSEELTIEAIAREIGWNPRKLSENFKRKYQIKLLDFISNVRIERSATLLYATNISITEISSLCGFASLRNFNRAFKNRMGMTPSDYRRERQRGCWKDVKNA